MELTPKAKLVRQRVIVARLCVRLARNMQKVYFSEQSFGGSSMLRMIAISIFLGTAEDHRAPTLATLSRQLETPRATVSRRLQTLIRLGYVRRIGRHYYVTEKHTERIQELVDLHVREIQRATKEMSKLDSGA